MAHTIFLIVLLILLLFLGYLVIQNIIFRIRHRPVPVEDGIPADPDQIATHLSQAIQCKTVPLDDTGTPDPEAFKQLHAFLKKTYPLVHKNIRLEVVNGFSLLYIWEGTNPKLEPIQLMAHQDVVSADPTEWTHPPFEGKLVDGFVWGRGSLDIKNQLIGILEAAEELLRQGYKPERTIHFAFGHDEETGGVNGAAYVGSSLDRCWRKGLSYDQIPCPYGSGSFLGPSAGDIHQYPGQRNCTCLESTHPQPDRCSQDALHHDRSLFPSLGAGCLAQPVVVWPVPKKKDGPR